MTLTSKSIGADVAAVIGEGVQATLLALEQWGGT